MTRRTNQPVRPATAVFVGRQDVEGMLFDEALLDEATVRDRLLALWQPGDEIYCRHGQWLMIFDQPRSLRDPWPTSPIVRQHGRLSNCPLTAIEAEALTLNAVHVLRGGSLEAWVPSPTQRQSPTNLVSLNLERLDVRSLGPPPARLVALAEPGPVERADLGVPELDDVGRLMLQELARPDETEPQVVGQTDPGVGERALQSLLDGVRWLRQRFSPNPGNKPFGDGSTTAMVPAEAYRPGWLDRLEDRLAQALNRSQLGRMLQRREASYVGDLVERLRNHGDENSLDDLLKRAVPLSAVEGSGLSRLPSLLPSARSDLTPNLRGHTGGSSGRTMAANLYDQLRDSYKTIADRLDEEGHAAKAAFVWADLLDDPHRAVALLERHGEYELAAKLAEARRLDAAMVARLFWLANDRARAITIARRGLVFAEVVERLERDNVKTAAILRTSWAAHLASGGHFEAAANTIAPVPSGRRLALRWLELAVEQGGAVAGRALGRLVLVEGSDEVAQRALSLLRQSGDDAARLALCRTIVTGATPWTATLSRAALRLSIDALAEGAELRNQLLRAANDSALRVDFVPQPPSAADDRPFLAPRVFEEHDVGTLSARDVLVLPGNLLLVALGETGVRLVSDSGDVLAHFDVVADRLVAAESGARALALKRVSSVHGTTLQRIHRIDLSARTASYWCDAELQDFAELYDGDSWFVVVRGNHGWRLAAVDTLAEDWQAIWQSDELGSNVGPVHVAFGDRPVVQTLASTAMGEASIWCWHRRRMTFAGNPTVNPDGVAAASLHHELKLGYEALAGEHNRRNAPGVVQYGRETALWVSTSTQESPVQMRGHDPWTGESSVWTFFGSRRVHARGHHLDNGHLVTTLIDDCGRLVSTDPLWLDLRLKL